MKTSTTQPLTYETDKALSQYMLFHYGSDQDQLPFSFGPKNALNFPVRCVTECLDVADLPVHATALELGCAVGRSSFELSRYCEHVLSIDYSQNFITAAKHIQQKGKLEYQIVEEGTKIANRLARIPSGVHPERIDFKCGNAMDLSRVIDKFDVVLSANVLCRMPDPIAFLNVLPHLVASKGQLILISPYSWLDHFTPRSNWIDNQATGSVLDVIQEVLLDAFDLQRVFDMSFLLRDHLRKYEWGVSQATIWKRKTE